MSDNFEEYKAYKIKRSLMITESTAELMDVMNRIIKKLDKSLIPYTLNLDMFNNDCVHIGYNYGADNRAELKNVFSKSVVFMTVSGAILTASAFLLASPLAKIFVGYDKELFELTKHAFYLFSFAFLLTGLNIFASNLFTALNNGLISAVISFLRTLVFQCIAVLILPELIGSDGIWYSIAIAEIAAFILSLIFIIAYRKKYHYMPSKIKTDNGTRA